MVSFEQEKRVKEEFQIYRFGYWEGGTIIHQDRE